VRRLSISSEASTAASDRLYAEAATRKHKREAAAQEAERKERAMYKFHPDTTPARPQPPQQQRRNNKPPATALVPKPPSPPVPAVVSRLVSSEARRKERLAQLEKERDLREKKLHTFAPNTGAARSPPSGDWVSRLSSTGKKDFSELERQKEQRDLKGCTFRPSISPAVISPSLRAPSPVGSVVSTPGAGRWIVIIFFSPE
jgi:hypothetical protein